MPPRPGRWPAKHFPKALLGHVMETRLSGAANLAETVQVTSPWDVWWVCYRAAVPLDQIGVQISLPDQACRACARDALAMAAASPPTHPDLTGSSRRCGCLLEWAVRMRAPAAAVAWPPSSLTLAMLKPGAPSAAIRAHLEQTHQVLQAMCTTLGAADTRRLYPEAYGADYVAARDRYLTSAPVTTLILRARPAPPASQTAPHAQAEVEPQGAGRIKEEIRAALGGGVLRNHLHMPDNPGEALADIAHLAGPEVLADVYERYERDRAAHRLAFYRAALGISETGPDRHTA